MSIQISDFDNALAARDKLIDEQRRKIDDYKYRYYNALDEADKANHDLDSMNEKFEKLLFEHRNLQQKYENLKEDSREDRKGFDAYAEKVEDDMKTKIKENENLKEKLNDAKNVIKNLQESLDEKVIEINTIQMAKAGEAKFTSETQTSLQEELAINVNKFSKEKSDLISKFTSLQSKINLQLVNLVESVKKLNDKKTPERCVYGWKCTRKFCRYSHDYLYSYKKSSSSKCDEIFVTKEHVERHKENLHGELKEAEIEVHQPEAVVQTQKDEFQITENGEDESVSSSSLSLVTHSSTSSISSPSSNSSFSTNSSEREEVGGVSRSNSS